MSQFRSVKRAEGTDGFLVVEQPSKKAILMISSKKLAEKYFILADMKEGLQRSGIKYIGLKIKIVFGYSLRVFCRKPFESSKIFTLYI
jgi:hypothetical protein